MATRHVAIVGGGFSGALLAINLLRHDGPRATLIERAPVAGEGIAYGAAHPTHVLNVRAGNMSAFPDEPDHFVRWLECRGEGTSARTFVPRRVYGSYLRELLDDALRTSGDRLTLVHGNVVEAIERPRPGVLLASGRRIDADIVALAVGNLPPHAPPGLSLDELPATRYTADPWHAPGLRQGEANGDVLILGTGLTMVDVALRLEAQGFAGRIVAMSRRGLVPRAHDDSAVVPARLAERPATGAVELLREVRGRAVAIGWQGAVDELRPFTQDLWRAAPAVERARFLRHLRPWWDTHRHRLAPEVAGRIAAMIACGKLTVQAGKPVRVDDTAGGVTVHWRRRGDSAVERLAVGRIVNCTGPQGDLLRADDPLLHRLIERGAIRPDACRIGIDVDRQSRTVSAAGTENDWLLALGPMTRGAFWEIVAVPDIRSQAWALARRLSNAHWVAGEGL